MILDVIGVALLAMAMLHGFRKGLLVAVFSVLGMLLGIVCALKLSERFAALLEAHGWVKSGWSVMVSYLLLLVGVAWLVRLMGSALSKSAGLLMLGWINKLLGGLLYVLFAATLWSSILWIVNQMHLLSPETLVQSRTYGWFQPIAPWVFEHAGALLPFAKNVFADLEKIFDHLNHQLPQRVGFN